MVSLLHPPPLRRGFHSVGIKKKKKEGEKRKGGEKNKENGWTKASPSHMVQINRLNKRVKCVDEMVGVGVLRE